jgi:hypothetical protein
MALSACLWPSEYYVVRDAPNSPPVIDKSALEPSSAQEVDGRVLWDPGAEGKALDFQLFSIEDADTQDTLFLRWYVCFDEDSPALNRFWGQEEIAPSGRTVRSSSRFQLTVGMARAVDDIRGARADGGHGERPYVVEVVVSDRAPTSAGLADTHYPEDAQTDRWRWVVVRANTGAE